jgi:hypothetical protein
MKQLFLSTISVIFLFSTAFTQSKVDILIRHKQYDSPNNKILPPNTPRPKNGELDIVMSDRNANVVYESASKSVKSSRELKFLEPFYVIGDEGMFYKLAEYTDENVKGRVLSNPKVVGFVEKSKLILWKQALRNEKNFVIKALSVVKGEVLVDKAQFISNEGQVKCFSAPSASNKYLITESGVKLFRFLFVVKEDEESNMSLLANSSAFSNSTKNRILGWVPNAIIQMWEDRICLEPNFDSRAVAARKRLGIAPSLLVTLDDSKKFKANPKNPPADTINLESKSEKPWEAYRKRMPVLNDMKDLKIVESGYTTDIVNSKGTVILEDTTWERLANDVNNRKVLLRNVNIVFIIDGSPALSPYLSSVTRAISNIKNDFTDDKKNLFKIKYGAVVYRNIEDISCGSEGDVSTTKLTLTNQFSEVTDWVERQKAIQGCHDNVVSKALFKGLSEAIKMFDSKVGKYESNYIILIGGAGNKSDPQEEKKLIDLFAKNNVNIFAYQYRKIDNPSFLSFQPDLVRIMKSGNQKMLQSANSEKSISSNESDIEWERKDVNNYYSYVAIENEKMVKFAEITWPEMGKNIEEEIFLKEMESFLGRITRKVNDNISEIDLMALAGNKADMSNAMKVLLNGIQSKVPKETILESFKNDRYQFFGRCYVPITANGLGAEEDLFSRTLFFTDAELQDLFNAFNNLAISLDDIEVARSNLYKACIEIASGYAGKNEAKEMSMVTLLTNLVGKEPKNSFWRSIRSLDDILDSKKVTDEIIKKVAKEFANKTDAIRIVKGDDSKRFKEDSDLIYYWVPEKVFP